MEQVRLEDSKRESEAKVANFAKFVPCNLSLLNSGKWTTLSNGDRIWRLKIVAEKSKGIVLYYRDFYMPQGAKLFVYTNDRLDVQGAFTNANNLPDGIFASNLTLTDDCTVEYYEPANVSGLGSFTIDRVSHAYRFVKTRAKGFVSDAKDIGDAGTCNVNAICTPESNNFQDAKRSVVRLLTSTASGSAFCSGALVNNVKGDCKGFILTANHCQDNDIQSNYSATVVQFNFEASTCTGATPASATDFMTGCTFKARSGNTGVYLSDFNLSELINPIPSSYNVFYAGWDASGTAVTSGVCISHPSGDLKKISTYSTPLTTSLYNGAVGTTHLKAVWVQTTNGYGITEGGSSGGPLFNQVGRIVGDLSGGPSSCTSANKADYFGNLAYSWTNNGATATNRTLKPWLDPDNTGLLAISGTNSPCTGFVLSVTPSRVSFCAGSTATSSIGVNMPVANTVTLSAQGVPTGVTATFSFTSLTATGSSTLNFTSLASAASGQYVITVTGTGGTVTNSTNITLTISSGAPSITLASPANLATNVSTSPVLSWATNTPASGYTVEIATNNTFTNIVSTGNVSSATYTPPTPLAISTQYYWRVRGTNNCGAGTNSGVYAFTTAAIRCTTLVATGLPRAIPDQGNINSTLTFGTGGTITDVNVIRLRGTHQYVGDLSFTLSGPTAASARLISNPCNSTRVTNFNLGFDDAGNTTAPPCPPTTGLNYTPQMPLSVFNTTNPMGTWTINATDNVRADTGSIIGWSLQICYIEPCQIMSTAQITHATTSTSNNGSIAVSVTGGTAPYSYTWSTGSTLNTITGLAPNTYTLTVSDNTCSATASYTVVNASLPLSATTTSTNSLCAAPCSGTALISVTGSIPPYSYAWSTNNATNSITGLCAGSYVVTVTSSNGATLSKAITITAPLAITATPSSQNLTCSNSRDGSISVTALGGSGQLRYLWSNNATSSALTGLAAGTFRLTVSDANNCSNVVSVVLTAPTAISAQPNITNVQCFGLTNGSITTTVAGGTPAYQYIWTSGATTANLSGLTAGSYTLTVTDSKGCTSTRVATVTQPLAALNVSITDNWNLSFDAVANGGSLPYTYLWNNGNTTTSASYNFNTNAITVTDVRGCTATSRINVAGLEASNANVKVFNAYPNPVTYSSLTIDIQFVNPEKASLKLYSTEGKLISVFKISETRFYQVLDLQHLASGQYFLHLEASGGRQIKSITKQ